MAITVSHTDETVEPDGTVTRSEPYDADVTADAVHYDIHVRLRGYLAQPASKRDPALDAIVRLVLSLDGARDVLRGT